MCLTPFRSTFISPKFNVFRITFVDLFVIKIMKVEKTTNRVFPHYSMNQHTRDEWILTLEITVNLKMFL